MPDAKTRNGHLRDGNTRLPKSAGYSPRKNAPFQTMVRRSAKTLSPADIDEFAHGLRSSLKEEETQYAKPPPAKPKSKYKPKASDYDRASGITDNSVLSPVEAAPSGVTLSKHYELDTHMGKGI